MRILLAALVLALAALAVPARAQTTAVMGPNGNISATGYIRADDNTNSRFVQLKSDGGIMLYRGVSATAPIVNGYVDFSSDPTFNRYGRLYYYDAGGQFVFQNTSNTASLVVQNNLNVSGTIYGDGSGLTNLPSSSGDRITSGTLAQVLAQNGGTVLISATGAYINNGGSNDARLAIGTNPSSNRYAYIDLVGDATYTGYGLRIIRENTGPNAPSWIQSRGTGGLQIFNQEAASIMFSTSSTERMRIDPNGAVGIGTSIPLANSAYGWLTLNGSTGGILSQSSNNSEMFRIQSVAGLATFINLVTSSTPLVFAVSNTELMRINPNGNVGIGTTAPGYTLDVSGSMRVFSASSPYLTIATTSGSNKRAGLAFSQNATPQMELGIDSSVNGTRNFYIWDSVSSTTRFLIDPNGNVGIGTDSPAYTLQVAGSVAGSSAYVNTSDIRLKKDIQPLPYGLADLMKLRPVSFYWKGQKEDWQKGRKLGLIAQEVEQVMPEVVSTAKDPSGTKSIAYGDITPLLIKSIQQQQTEIEALKAQLKAANDNIRKLQNAR